MKTSPISSIPTRKNKILLLLLGLMVLSGVMSVCLGAVSVAPGDILSVLLGNQRGTPPSQIILYSRLPRTCGCLLAGSALAVSGAVIQNVLHNPLAAPNVIGVNSGAGLAVALCSAIAPSAVWAVPAAAFCGALAGCLLVFFVSKATGASRMTLVLAGIALSGMFGAGIDAVIKLVPDALNGYSDFRIGGFSNLSMARIAPAFWVILIALLAVFALAGEMDVLALGEETARSLGLSTQRVRLVLLGCAAALAGGAVSFAGLVGFVGLIVPHAMRRLAGGEGAAFLAACALGGGALVTFCDIGARLLFAPYDLPVGIVLSLLGGGFFLWLLVRQKGGHRG